MIYGQKGTDFSPPSSTMFVSCGSAQQDLLCPCLSEVAPPEASRMLGEDEEAAAGEWGEEGALKSDKVKRVCEHREMLSNIVFLVYVAGLVSVGKSLMRRSLRIPPNIFKSSSVHI